MLVIQWRPVVADADVSGSSFICHFEVLKECSAEKRRVVQSAGGEVCARKGANDGEVQTGDINLCDVIVDWMRAVNAGHSFTVYDCKSEIQSKCGVDATFCCASIHQGEQPCFRQVWTICHVVDSEIEVVSDLHL